MKKIGLITGGSRGIGLATCSRLSKDGYQVLMVGTLPAHEVKCLKDSHNDYYYIQADISSKEGRSHIVQTVKEAFGRVDLLVNNAGVAPSVRSDLLEMSEESWDRVIDTNLKGTMFLTQSIARIMLEQPLLYKKRGTIINISSVSSYVVSANRGEYCVSKAGISMLTSLYAHRLAREGILVHELRPGVIRTDMTSGVEQKYNQLIQDGFFPIARWGTAEDVANAVAVFASDDLLYTTGNGIDIDGGFHIQSL